MENKGEQELSEISRHLKEELKNGTTPAGRPATVRDILEWFGYSRRGASIVNQIRDVLARVDLRTEPDFENEYIDGPILIKLNMDAAGVRREPPDPTVRIGVLKNAHETPTSVRPNDSLQKAMTTMLMKDFSQLPVMVNDRDVKGMVTWQSIGTMFALGREAKEVRQCMDKHHREITIDAPFLDALGVICEHGYVLVRDVDRRISGIVTATDFASQFAQLARPFLIIGEIELHLRNLVGRFTLGELAEAADDDKRPINGTADLNFGAYCRLLETPERWDKLQLGMDRSTFMAHLDRARQIRNEVMHFAADGHDPKDVEDLERVALFLRRLTEA